MHTDITYYEHKTLSSLYYIIIILLHKNTNIVNKKGPIVYKINKIKQIVKKKKRKIL